MTGRLGSCLQQNTMSLIPLGALMKYAVHSIIWGQDAKIDKIAREARAAGYSGVELFQHPEKRLGGHRKIYDILSTCGLTLVGVCGGSFEERCDFVRKYSDQLSVTPGKKEAPYIYIDEWREETFKIALAEGLKLAIHPHMFKTIQTLAETERLLREHRSLRFVPDTAHLTIAGDDPVSAYLNNSNRIDVVHIKDWRDEVGRSYQFYARGFCELGQGSIDLKKFIASIHRFDGWLVVEQDLSDNPATSIRQSLRWLKANSPT